MTDPADIIRSLNDPATWDRIADHIGLHPYTYDMGDSSHRLDIVQIVSSAAAAVLAAGSTDE